MSDFVVNPDRFFFATDAVKLDSFAENDDMSTKKIWYSFDWDSNNRGSRSH